MIFAGFLILLGCFLSIVLLIKFPRFMLGFGIGALALQLLLYTTRSTLINDSFSDLPSYFVVLSEINPGFLLGVVTSIFPFPIPLIAAYLVGSITMNLQLGVTAFFLFAVIQVVLIGVFTKSEASTGISLKAITAYAIPLFSFVVTLANLFLPGDQQILDLASVGNNAVFVSICCCLVFLSILFLIIVKVVMDSLKKSQKHKR
jgi:hypothetical protein